MKNYLVLSLLALGFVSCSKDSFDERVVPFTSIDKSEIYVTVSYLTWTESSCEPGCAATTHQTISNIVNASVNIFQGSISDSDQVAEPLHQGTTDQNGSSLFTDIEPGQYTVTVDTQIGKKSRTIYTQLNRRASIDFSF